jgi:hypothetical protein
VDGDAGASIAMLRNRVFISVRIFLALLICLPVCKMVSQPIKARAIRSEDLPSSSL